MKGELDQAYVKTFDKCLMEGAPMEKGCQDPRGGWRIDPECRHVESNISEPDMYVEFHECAAKIITTKELLT